jgi:hypothetical protein
MPRQINPLNKHLHYLVISAGQDVDWSPVVARCQRRPDEIMEQDATYGRTPLHLAFILHAPVKVLAAMFSACPASGAIQDKNEMSPYHFSLGKHPEELLQSMLHDNPGVASKFIAIVEKYGRV